MGLNDAVFVLIFLSAFPIMYVSIFPVPNSLYTYRKNGSFFSNISLLLEYTLFHVKYQWKLAKWIIHLKCRYEWIPKYLIGYEWNMYKSVLWGDSAYTSNNGPNQKLCATIRNI